MCDHPLLQTLRDTLGSAHVLTAAEDRAAYETDWRRRWHGHAMAVVRPGSTDEAAAVLRACAAHRVSIVPQGGNTGLVGGGVPDGTGGQILLSTRRMNAVREIDTDNLTITVEAGCVLQQVQEAAAARGLLFPLSLAAEGSCTIGGNLATNAGGTQVLRFGNTRDLCLGLEIVTPRGEVWSGLSGLRKDNTGYDLRHLFIGAEGTLGVITAASLKLFPAPRSVATAFVAVPTPASAVSLLAELRRHCGDLVSSFELIPDVAIDLVVRHLPGSRSPLQGASPWYVLCEITSAMTNEPLAERLEVALAAALEAGLVTDATIAQSERERQDFWFIREHIPEAQRRDGPSIKHDISLPLDRLAEFITSTSAWLREQVPEGVLVCYGHVGDGNLHFNINQSSNAAQSLDAAQPPNAAAAGALLPRQNEIRRVIHDRVHALSGSFSAEHGIGPGTATWWRRHTDAAQQRAIATLAGTCDPLGVLGHPGLPY